MTQRDWPAPNGDRVTNPVAHPVQDVLDAIFLVMGLVGAAAMILGLFLIYNTIDAIITEQTSQIGVMKAIGGGMGQILWSYLILIFVYGALGIIVSIPLAAIGAWYIYLLFADLFNFVPTTFTIDPASILVQVAIALFAPLVAALIPISIGVRITVREAISTYGFAGRHQLVGTFGRPNKKCSLHRITDSWQHLPQQKTGGTHPNYTSG